MDVPTVNMTSLHNLLSWTDINFPTVNMTQLHHILSWTDKNVRLFFGVGVVLQE